MTLDNYEEEEGELETVEPQDDATMSDKCTICFSNKATILLELKENTADYNNHHKKTNRNSSKNKNQKRLTNRSS